MAQTTDAQKGGQRDEVAKMSVEAFTWALSVPVGGSAKVVLLGLANHAHPDGTEAYPSRATLAKYANCDPSTALRNVRKLQQLGWIKADGNGPHGEVKYRLAMTDEPIPEEERDGKTDGGGRTQGVASATKGVASAPSEMPPEPSLEPSIEPSGENASAREPDSDPIGDVWAHYQRTIPNGNRRKLGSTQRRVIKNALKVRSVDECCKAISGLASSDYHVSGGYLDVKYALLGGGRSPSIEDTIERWCKKVDEDARVSAAAPGSVTGGNGRPSVDYAKYDQHVIREDLAS